MLLDLAVSLAATGLTLLVVDFFFTYPVNSITTLRMLATVGLTSLIAFYLWKSYRRVVRHSGMTDVAIIMCVAATKVFGTYLVYTFIWKADMTDSVYYAGALVDFLLTTVFLVGERVLVLMVFDTIKRSFDQRTSNVLIYGIGEKSASLLKMLNFSKNYKVAGFLAYDINDPKINIENEPVFVFCGEDDFEKILQKIQIRYILFPTYVALNGEKDRLVKYCQDRNIKMLISPNIDHVNPNNGELKLGIREIKIEDLLGRAEIKVDMEAITHEFQGKTVLVTGAAGSIGSEICRQLMEVGVGKLVMYDSAESAMHELRLYFEDKYGADAPIEPIVGDVRLYSRLRTIFERTIPQIIFHAAAYKHVPLMEENPCEGIFVNVVGTRYVANLAVEFGAEKMVMISTDKAVNPTNVMGATKRAAEMYVQGLGEKLAREHSAAGSGNSAANVISAAVNNKVGSAVKAVVGTVEEENSAAAGSGNSETAAANSAAGTYTKFVTTRFGNVLGSNGSVIPRFRQQLLAGGPLTVTSDQINRFFMSIPEACRLVMEAATIGNGNDIYVFDMGEPVRIIDLARRMIQMAGYVPGEEIDIKITGLRKGEKLYEEVLNVEENTIPTSNKKIKRAKTRSVDYEMVNTAIDELYELSHLVYIDQAVKKLKELVPEFISQNSEFEKFDKK